MASFRSKFAAALGEFKHYRSRCTRIAVDGREFVLVDRLTDYLTRPPATSDAPHLLEQLRASSHFSLSTGLPPLSLTELRNKYLRIFYILLEIGHHGMLSCFKEHGLTDDRLPFDGDLSRFLRGEQPSFLDAFLHAQFAWCPVVIELGIGQFLGTRILPIVRKEPIEPRRAGDLPPGGGNSKIWEVLLPEELIGRRLKEQLPYAKVSRPADDNDESLYKFVLKEYPEARRSAFENERRAFEALKDQEGMIKYIGSFVSESVASQPTGNILLESADFDLYTALRQTSPPVLPEEIAGFWVSMLELTKALRNIHNLEVDGYKYHMWHGDIKPENILRVRDSFKLADPGEARVSLCSSNCLPRPVGGTRTYASPEISEYFQSRSPSRMTDRKVDQSIDIWSLGCVFSVAATYVVLGTQGVLQYDGVRRHSSRKASAECATNAFHDGVAVLPCVTTWHEYLRLSLRRTDSYTSNIITLIDEHMLVPAEKRLGSEELHDKLDDIIRTAGSSLIPIPATVETMLREVDLDAELHYENS